MNLTTRLNGKTLTIALTGELDESNAAYVRETSDSLIEKKSIDKFVYDVSKLNFMDSTGIGVILGRYKKLRSLDIKMYISKPNSQVMKVIKTSGIDGIINII